MTSPKQTTLFSRAPLTRVEERKGERIARADLATRVALVLSLVAIGYAFLAGLRTLTVTDLGWQLATARWIVQHYEIPSTDVFSYTAQGQLWVYPVGSGLLFYGAYLLGVIRCCHGSRQPLALGR